MTQSSERPAKDALITWGNHGNGLNIYSDGKYVGTVAPPRGAFLSSAAAQVACEHVHDMRRAKSDG